MSNRITEEEYHLLRLAKELIDTIESEVYDTRRFSGISRLSFDIYRMSTQNYPYISESSEEALTPLDGKVLE